MTLSAASALFYWDARHGAVPVVGGYPAHARSSAAAWIDRSGHVNDAIVNTPRFPTAALYGDPEHPAAVGVRRPVLRLERSGTNLVATDVGSWTSDRVTVTPGQADPRGGAGASLLATTGSGGSRTHVITLTGDGRKGLAIALKQGSAASNQIGLFDGGTSTWYELLTVTWTAGVPVVTVAAGSGAVAPVQGLADGWWLIQCGPAGVVASHTNSLTLYPGTAGGTGSVYAYNPQLENSAAPSSLMALSASRAADAMQFGFAAAPQAMVGYCRFVERGAVATSTALWSITDAAEDRAFLRCFSDGTNYQFQHFNASTDSAAGVAAASTLGDTVELAVVLYADGHTMIGRSVNGAAVASGTDATPAALAAAWSGPALYLNARGAGSIGQADFADVRVVKLGDVVASTAQGIMDELRAFRLSAAGERL